MKCTHKVLIAVLVHVLSVSALAYDITPVGNYAGDLNSDVMVDGNDLFILANQWLQSPGDPNADIAPNGGDGIVNLLDFSVLAKDWGQDFALAATRSGYDCAKYLATTVTGLPSTANNTVSASDATNTWVALCTYIQNNPPGGQSVPAPTRFTDANGTGNQLVTPAINCGTGNVSFILRFYRYDSDSNTIMLESTGIYGSLSRKITVDMKIQKSVEVLRYAIASKPRVWITGDSTVHGNIYSSWKYQNISPFNTTSDSIVDGTINTILTKGTTVGHYGDLYAGSTLMPYHLETLDENGNSMYNSDGSQVISSSDEIQGQCQGINYNVNYGEKATNMPGMDLADYDTTAYKNQTTVIATSNYTGTATEYFPHNTNDYTHGPSGSLKITRSVCQNKTLTNARVAAGKNALFKNCTFNGILYVDNSTAANNVRFENCVFNGPIVTTPSTDTTSGWWQRNQLYFTGTETFQNNTTVPATILAPNFSVNLGNIYPMGDDNAVLTGAIIGGIVDIRGNAQIYGTIISMFDTSTYPSGYVSNIGTYYDGLETIAPGVIDITPNSDQLLPSGITTPIVIVPLQSTYRE